MHGNIGLSKLEAEVVSSRAFQRLHNVRQLGLANLVYPGANYSRFSHSIGACHNAGRLVNAIRRNAGEASISDEKVRAYRLAGLLHDLGHYPFSHATEHVIENYYTEQGLFVDDANSATSDGSSDLNRDVATTLETLPPSFDHEKLGEIILRNDEEIGGIFKQNGFSLALIVNIFGKLIPDNLVGIISSDLDCDRLDYLRRTAHHSGAPYGSVDIDYIIDQATLDSDGRFCFGPKALRSTDHLLVSRYYDYMQVPYNKTVAALEWSLVTSLRALFDNKQLDCSARSVLQQIRAGTWVDFDDQHVVGKFRELLKSRATSTDPADVLLVDHITAILGRRPAKMIGAWESISPKRDAESYQRLAKLAEVTRTSVAAKHGLDPDRLHIWRLSLPLTKIDSHMRRQDVEDEQLAIAVHILNSQSGKGELLIHKKESLLSHLSEFQFTGVRLYYLPKGGNDDQILRAALRNDFEAQLGKASSGS